MSRYDDLIVLAEQVEQDAASSSQNANSAEANAVISLSSSQSAAASAQTAGNAAEQISDTAVIIISSAVAQGTAQAGIYAANAQASAEAAALSAALATDISNIDVSDDAIDVAIKLSNGKSRATLKTFLVSLTADGLGASFENPTTSDQAFILRSRHVGSTPIPVPTFQPNGPLASYPMGVDFMPKGLPGVYSTNGIVWLDVCSRDILNSNATPTVSARVAVFDDHIEFGSRPFNGASNVPVYMCVGGVITAVLKVDGTTEYTGQILSNKSTNAQYIGLTAQNTNPGTAAYAQAEVKGSNATLQLRTYSTGFTGSAGYANTSDVSATGTGGLVLSTQSAAAPIHLVPGSTAKANAKISIDVNGVAFFGGVTVGKRAATPAATDLASAITLVNALRDDSIAFNLKSAA